MEAAVQENISPVMTTDQPMQTNTVNSPGKTSSAALPWALVAILSVALVAVIFQQKPTVNVPQPTVLPTATQTVTATATPTDASVVTITVNGDEHFDPNDTLTVKANSTIKVTVESDAFADTDALWIVYDIDTSKETVKRPAKGSSFQYNLGKAGTKYIEVRGVSQESDNALLDSLKIIVTE